ncbi:hypothetical protein [Actinocorallia libanotica]|uniref:Uncharacterized protein n=1 Tax=Actinocorallia libanotica TaxID=46162 RepID=A0ABP4CKI6_9ACTN
MASREEIKNGIDFAERRAAHYQQIADDGGNEQWGAERAQQEATSFAAHAASLQARLTAK